MGRGTVTSNATAAASEADRYVDVKEAARLQLRSEISVRRDLTKGRLRRFKCGARTLLLLSDVLGQIRET